jgi:seryl-tRNA synthetase
MLDIKWIRDNPEAFNSSLKRRGLGPVSSQVLEIDKKYRSTVTDLQGLQNRRNIIAKNIGEAKSRGNDITYLSSESSHIKKLTSTLEKKSTDISHELSTLLLGLPNVLSDDVPDGFSKKDNQVLRTVGNKPSFTFNPLPHYELGEKLGQMDFERARRMSGSRFVVLKEDLARLERALASFMLDLHTQEFGYKEISPPYLVRDSALIGTGQLPKFGEDQFQTIDNRWLIPTAEVPLTNLVNNEIVKEEDLPMRFVAYTACFRSEAGSAGKDTRGMIRMHQFSKVELVSITHPEESLNEQERMTGAAEQVLKLLDLPYRVVILCAGDTGACSRKTYDLEVWLPSEEVYREISSCSSFGDYQSRRMHARFYPKGKYKTKPRLVHTLNGSGLAVGRTLVAVLENNQQEDGSILIPEIIRSYMYGQRIIKKNGQ